MHRCLVGSVDWACPEISLPPEEAHHLVNVLRLREGEHVVICDGMGSEAEGVVMRVSASGVDVRFLPETIMRRLRSSRLWLFQAVPKGKRMDLAVAKGTELGVTDIVPVMTERVVVRLEAMPAERKVARWQRIAEEAAKQCGSPWVPRVHAVASLVQVLAGLDAGLLTFVGALAVDARPICRVVGDVGESLSGDVGLFIGPEGDFTPGELESICRGGALPVSLGPRVLRTETAAIFGLSILSAARDALG